MRMFKNYFWAVLVVAVLVVVDALGAVAYAAEKDADSLAGRLESSLTKLSYSALAMNHAYNYMTNAAGIGSNAEDMNLSRGISSIKSAGKDYAKLLNFAGMLKSVDSSEDASKRADNALKKKLASGGDFTNLDSTLRRAKLLKLASDGMIDGVSSELSKIVKDANNGVKKGVDVKKYESILETAKSAQELLNVRKNASKAFGNAMKSYEKQRPIKISKEEQKEYIGNFANG